MRSVDIQYTEEEKNFIRKYGEIELFHWKSMSNSQKQEYKEIDNYYSIFANLFSEHNEDLKLYALMYRNTCLYNCDKDPISVLFFSSKKDEIIGFKKKLLADKKSDKAKIAFLYYDNVALFPKFVEKYTGRNIRPHQPMIQTIYCSLIRDFKEANYNHVFSVNDLSESDCKTILANKKYLKKDYLLLCNDHKELFHSSYNFLDERDFLVRFFIPFILNCNISFWYKRFVRYVKINKGKSNLKELVKLKKDHQLYVKQTYCSSEKIKKLNEQIAKLKNEDSSFMHNPNIERIKLSLARLLMFYKPDQKEYIKKEAELKNELYEIERIEQNEYNNWLKDKQVRLERLKDETESIEKQKRVDFEILVSKIKSTEIFHFVYSHYNNIEQYITECHEKLYNILWLRKPKYMRELESHTTSADSIRNIFDEESKKWRHGKILTFRKNRRTSKIDFIYNNRGTMRIWCETIAQKNEEEQKNKREQELRLFKEEEEKRKREAEQKRKEEEARRAKFEYNKNNRHYRDSYISFDEATHLYKVNGEILQSVTNFVDGCFPKFNAEFFAKKKAAYMGISTQEVLDMWEQKGKESRELGTELHKKIENYYQDIASTEDDTFKLFLTFANKVKLKPYRTEWAVYDFKHKIAGTIDFVDYQNGEYIIYDWKRSEKIIENGMPVKISKYDEKGNHPLEHLDNTPYYHYALQLSLYKYILEKNYGMKISDLRLGIFHPAYNKPYVLRIPYLEKEINDIFNLRSEVIF